MTEYAARAARPAACVRACAARPAAYVRARKGQPAAAFCQNRRRPLAAIRRRRRAAARRNRAHPPAAALLLRFTICGRRAQPYRSTARRSIFNNILDMQAVRHGQNQTAFRQNAEAHKK